MDNVRDRLAIGVDALSKAERDWKWREDNYRGDQELPFAPEGVSAEYLSLREQSIANVLQVVMDAPVQRMEVESVSDQNGATDSAAWNVLIDNSFDELQQTIWTQMMVHARAICAVSKRPGQSPKITVENSRRVYLHPDPEDGFRHAWAVKRWTETPRSASSLWVPSGVHTGHREVAVVYDERACVRFERSGAGVGDWQLVRTTAHGLGELPFVDFSVNLDADGVPHPAIDDLIPMQCSLNTIRFNTLLAMQFSAYRQRVATGYDPVLRDQAGNVVYLKDQQGNEIVGPDGQPVPALRPGGRPGVDRFLVFPGKDTKVFDLDESNLSAYIDVWNSFLTAMFTKAQTPPSYGVDRMANLSGDALAGAEAALLSLVSGLKRSANGGLRRVLRLVDRAEGREPVNRQAEWVDTAPKSFGQIVDGVTKLISVEFPHRAAFDMLPGATPVKVDQWMEQRRGEIDERFSAQLLEQFTAEPVTDVAG